MTYNGIELSFAEKSALDTVKSGVVTFSYLSGFYINGKNFKQKVFRRLHERSLIKLAGWNGEDYSVKLTNLGDTVYDTPRIYGGSGTIHQNTSVDVETNKTGEVVAVWFRCQPIAFVQTVVDVSRSQEMKSMYSEPSNPVPGVVSIAIQD